MRFVSAVVAPLLLATTPGCGGGPQFAPVSGRVTVNGQPVVGVMVSFQPVASAPGVDPGPGSSGLTDADGRFVLHSQLNPGQLGAVVGKHRVSIWPPEGSQDRDADASIPSRKKGSKADLPLIPGRYHVNSELTFDVPPGGTDKADFHLTAP